MSAFLDSSAVVKLYADEEGSDLVRELEATVVSALARVEVPAAIWRKSRIGELPEEDAAVLVSEFEADYFGTAGEPPRFLALTVTSSQLNRAAALLPVHGLRAYDALQLAGAIAAKEADPDCHTFVCFDRQLNRAARTHGLTTRNFAQ